MAAKVPTAPRLLGRAALACALHQVALVVPWQALAAGLGLALTASNPLHHPLSWTGKLAALLVSGFVLYGLRWVRPAGAGLQRPRPGSLRAAGLVVSVVALGVLLNAYLVRQAFGPLWWHERLFYSLVPGLEEELFYRGVLLGLLGAVFPRTIPLPGTRTSWGGFVSVLLFGLGHGIRFNSIGLMISNWLAGGTLLAIRHVPWWQPLLYFSLAEVAYPLAMGLLFLWVRERTGSVWAAVAAHCLLNTALTIGRTLT